jgi:hypothetical protein
LSLFKVFSGRVRVRLNPFLGFLDSGLDSLLVRAGELGTEAFLVVDGAFRRVDLVCKGKQEVMSMISRY